MRERTSSTEYYDWHCKYGYILGVYNEAQTKKRMKDEPKHMISIPCRQNCAQTTWMDYSRPQKTLSQPREACSSIAWKCRGCRSLVAWPPFPLSTEPKSDILGIGGLETGICRTQKSTTTINPTNPSGIHLGYRAPVGPHPSQRRISTVNRCLAQD